MKRSEINTIISETKTLLAEFNTHLPPFAFWSPDDWAVKGEEYDEIRTCMLGWDITDFGSEDFEKIGLVLFTVRNGHRKDPRYTGKTYCEKILVVRENQRTPMHFHDFKQEDIICRNGGKLACQVYQKASDGGLSDENVILSVDGMRRTVPAGHTLVLSPGESITFTPHLYHEFWAVEGTGTSIVGEVSRANDDATDNSFLTAPGRFASIEEDEPPLHLLCVELDL